MDKTSKLKLHWYHVVQLIVCFSCIHIFVLGAGTSALSQSESCTNCTTSTPAAKDSYNCSNYNYSAICKVDKPPLYIVAMGPYPGDPSPGWLGGPVVVPAVLLAAQHINCDPQILQEYQLKVIISDGGCNVRIRATTNFTTAVYLTKRKDGNVVGIVGGGCSESAFAVAELVHNNPLSLIQISPSATSPLFVTEPERNNYQNTIRLAVNALVFIKVFKEIIMRKGYSEIAILHDSNRSYMVTVANEFEKSLKGIDVIVRRNIGLSSAHLIKPLDELRGKNRVIFVFASGNIAAQILCLAYKTNMRFPRYQLIFINRRRENLKRNVTIKHPDTGEIEYNCTEDDMVKALPTATLFEPRVKRLDNDTTKLVSGYTFKDYDCQYKEVLKEHLAQLNISQDGLPNTDYQNAYYDSTWALAKSLHSAEQDYGVDLSKYKYGQLNETQIILEQFFNVSFEGASGKVSFNRRTLDTEEVAIVDIFQERDGMSKLVASHSAKSNLTIMNEFFFLNESVFQTQVFIHPPAALGSFVISVVILVIIIIAVIHYLNGTLGELKVVKASSPQLNHLIFSGCYLLLIGVIFYSCLSTIFVATNKPNAVLFSVFCNSQLWVSTYSISLIFGTICMKTWRIWRIFGHFSSKAIKLVGDKTLIGFIVGLIALDTVYLVIWNSVDPLYMQIHVSTGTNHDQRIAICYGDNLQAWLSILLVYKVLIVVLLLYLSISTRKVNKMEFKQTKSINALIYLLLFVTVLGIVPYAIATGSQTFDRGFIYAAYVLYSVAFVSAAVMCTIFVFLPPIYPTLRRKWEKFKLNHQS